MRTKLYQLTDGDKAIIEKARRTKNPNWFTNYYLRSEDSGTYWRPPEEKKVKRLFVPEFQEKARLWVSGYEQLFKSWKKLGKPEYFIETNTAEYEVLTEDQYKELLGQTTRRHYHVKFELEFSDPVFHHNHGFVFLSWYLEAHRTTQPFRTIIGGMGSGKTLAAAVEMLYWAAILRSFRGFALAPWSVQSDEVYDLLMKLVEDTLYEERFIIKSPLKPMKHIVIGHSGIGRRNSIECYPILDGAVKVRTLTGDAAMVDQTELFPELGEIKKSAGTRFRGQVSGRPRLGKFTFLANSGDSPDMWDLYDQALEDPDMYWSASPTSAENIYLTIDDMLRYQELIGNTRDEQDMFLRGKKPKGSGEWFSADSLERCHAVWMDDLMAQKQEEQSILEDNGGFIAPQDRWIVQRAKGCDVFHWEIPPEKDGQYIVIADPGWKNPPHRDAAVVAVWKINGYPIVPAHMVAFHWVFGNGAPDPWMNVFTEYVVRYKAWAQGGYDATGNGAAYGRMDSFSQLQVDPINLSANWKRTYITWLQKLLYAGKLQMPDIPHLYNQLSRYKYPEKLHDRQDIVMMMVVTAAWLERMQYFDPHENEEPEEPEPQDRYDRQKADDRYGATIR